MYIRDLIASLLRRWYLLVTGLLLTVALCIGAYMFVPVSYQAKGSVLLLPPASSVGARGNPYLYLGGLAQAVEVLSARMNATEIRKPIQDQHPDATIEIGQDVESTGPIVAVVVSSVTAVDTTATVEQVLSALPTTLLDMQDLLDVPESSRITSIRLTSDITVEAVTKARDRAVIALAGVGLAGTILLVGLIDGLLLGRLPRLRRAVEPAPGWRRTGDDEDQADGQVPAGGAVEQVPLPQPVNGEAQPARADAEEGLRAQPVEVGHRTGSDRPV